MLETLGSTKKIENTDLIPDIRYLKDKLMNDEVESYAWLRSEENLADIFTKDMKENQEVRDLFIWNKFKNGASQNNMVVKDGMELKMVNPVNRDDWHEIKKREEKTRWEHVTYVHYGVIVPSVSYVIVYLSQFGC